MNDLATPPEVIAAERPPFAAGVFPDMPAAAYHAIEALSASGGKKLRQSPMHYRLMRDTPNEPTPAMEFGTAVHAGVLEPESFAELVTLAPSVNRRTKDGKAEWQAFAALNVGRIIMAPEDYVRAQACIRAVHAHPAAAKLLDGGERELSLFWEDARYKVPCKCRFDAINHGGGIDLKTTQDASPEGFARSIAAFQYHAQAAHYISGAEHALNESPRFFAFIAVESEPPHAVACYVLPAPAILAGQHLAAIALERYAEALASGKWKGYSDTIDSIQLPGWALKFNH